MPSLRSGSRFLFFSLIIQAASPLSADNHCIELTSVDINDTQILSRKHQDQLVSTFIGKCIDSALLQNILATVSNRYIELGYVTTRPYFEQQDINDGQVDIEVLIGQIESIIDAESGSSNAGILTAFAFHPEILNLRSLETALETIERVPSVSADFEIRPGSSQGESVVAIKTVESSPLRLVWGVNAQTDLDNRASLRASLDNPFSINDRLQLDFNSGELREKFQSNRSEALSYSFPIGRLLISLNHSEVSYEQRLQGINESFLSSGETESDQIELSAVVARSRSYKLGLSLALQIKDTDNFFEDQLLEVSSYRTSQARLGLDQLWFRPWGQISFDLQLHRGLDSFGARDDDFFTLEDGSESEAKLQFEKWVANSRLIYFFQNSGWSYDAQLSSQHSDDILFDNDRINLGSPFTVRGYSSALSGSNGWYWRNDFTHNLQEVLPSGSRHKSSKSLSYTMGLDYGEIDCEIDNPDVCGQIYGLGAGVSISDPNFNARLLWGHPLEKLSDDIGDKEQYYFDVSWVF